MGETVAAAVGVPVGEAVGVAVGAWVGGGGRGSWSLGRTGGWRLSWCLGVVFPCLTENCDLAGIERRK